MDYNDFLRIAGAGVAPNGVPQLPRRTRQFDLDETTLEWLFHRLKFALSALMIAVGLMIAANAHGSAAVAGGVVAFAGGILLIVACRTRDALQRELERYLP